MLGKCRAYLPKFRSGATELPRPTRDTQSLMLRARFLHLKCSMPGPSIESRTMAYQADVLSALHYCPYLTNDSWHNMAHSCQHGLQTNAGNSTLLQWLSYNIYNINSLCHLDEPEWGERRLTCKAKTEAFLHRMPNGPTIAAACRMSYRTASVHKMAS